MHSLIYLIIWHLALEGDMATWDFDDSFPWSMDAGYFPQNRFSFLWHFDRSWNERLSSAVAQNIQDWTKLDGLIYGWYWNYFENISLKTLDCFFETFQRKTNCQRIDKQSKKSYLPHESIKPSKGSVWIMSLRHLASSAPCPPSSSSSRLRTPATEEISVTW